MSNDNGHFSGPIVSAVVVTYEPCKQQVVQLLQALVSQVSRVVVVDNASLVSKPSEWSLCSMFPKLELHLRVSNDGIAVAQNYGIAKAVAAGSSHVLLCDQDSIPEPDMVEKLLMGLSQSDGSGGKLPVAVISPATVDSRTGHISTFISSETRAVGAHVEDGRGQALPTIEAGFLISSGMLIPAEVFGVVRGLRSDYFIDHVDTEWCFRARAAGYRLVGLELPLLRHSLGDEVQKVWLFRERHVSTHAPLRDYYMARNTLAMIKGGDLSVGWCMHFLWRIVQFFGFYVLLSNNKRQHLKMLFLGLAHGLRGISGKLNPQTLQTEPVPRSPLDPD
jgi:rhamnosyltransferase